MKRKSFLKLITAALIMPFLPKIGEVEAEEVQDMPLRARDIWQAGQYSGQWVTVMRPKLWAELYLNRWI